MSSTLPVPIGARDLASELLFADALKSAYDYALEEKAPATRRAYASDFAHFEAWCATMAAEPLPASVATLAAYLASLADAGRKASTIGRRCAAIAHRHRQAGYEPPTTGEKAKAVHRGIRRKIGTRPDQKAPATAKRLKAMLRRIPTDLAGLRDRAVLLIGFAAALRRSELVGLTMNDIERVPDGILVHVRRSKTDQVGAGHVIAVPRGTKLCPVDALDAWLAAATVTDGPVFRAVGKGGAVSFRALSDRSVADIVKRWAGAAGLDPALFSGHSLRAGLVTTALEHGADILKVMAVTRHRSVDTLRLYDRRANAFKDHAGKGFL